LGKTDPLRALSPLAGKPGDGQNLKKICLYRGAWSAILTNKILSRTGEEFEQSLLRTAPGDFRSKRSTTGWSKFLILLLNIIDWLIVANVAQAGQLWGNRSRISHGSELMVERAREIVPESRRGALAKVDQRTKEARLLRETRAALIGHVGGNPSTDERALIERAIWQTLRVAQ
jgi:hypothetical protein